MKNELEKLKAQNAEMLKKIHEMNAALEAITELEDMEDEIDETDDEEVYIFTKEEMVSFVITLHTAFSEATEQTIKDMDFNDSSYYDLSLHGNEIEVEIDSSTIASDIANEMDMDDDEESILDTVNSIYDRVKKEL